VDFLREDDAVLTGDYELDMFRAEARKADFGILLADPDDICQDDSPLGQTTT
jgi:hypothetical protein